MSERMALDFGKVKFSKEKMSFDAAVKEVSPVQWPEEISSGKKKLTVKKIQKDYEEK